MPEEQDIFHCVVSKLFSVINVYLILLVVVENLVSKSLMNWSKFNCLNEAKTCFLSIFMKEVGHFHDLLDCVCLIILVSLVVRKTENRLRHMSESRGCFECSYYT